MPRKDQCDICLGTKHGAISEEDFVRHRDLKTKAQETKKEDKLSAENSPDISCWTMDLQAVLLSPKTEASCMFYKTKLQLHNFTLFCFETKAGYCYAWDECNGGLSSDVFAWLQYQYGLVWFRGLTPQQQPGSYQGGEMMMKSVFWWRKPEHPEETTDLRQVTDETFHTYGLCPVRGSNSGRSGVKQSELRRNESGAVAHRATAVSV